MGKILPIKCIWKQLGYLDPKYFGTHFDLNNIKAMSILQVNIVNIKKKQQHIFHFEWFNMKNSEI